ncbi:SMP-30/gluconolactonase/LRE family protein [Sphingorhabdus sp.]|jgi:sugar lactone lactonase YvrE|uniref:SMP-30/gluconolactonase/LRE family protein n=1 Tax=Sphingorhabdus sp. TaxID=1902408 RepID=UPI0037CA4C19
MIENLARGDVELLYEAPGLFEGPLWDQTSGTLIYTDASGGGVWRIDPTTCNNECVVPHRKGIGGLAAHSEGGFIMAGKDVIWRRGEDRGVLIANDPAWGLNRFNDLTTDPAGRVYAGALDYDPEQPDRPRNPGRLFVVDLDASVRQVDDGLGVPNGIAISPAGDLLYLADTSARMIWVYDIDSRGDLHGRRSYGEFGDGEPDGLAVDVNGALWVAVRSPGSLSVYAGGERVARYEVHSHPTSLCFGGSDLRDIYLTTSGGIGKDGNGVGQVYRLRAPVAGLACAPARVLVSEKAK